MHATYVTSRVWARVISWTFYKANGKLARRDFWVKKHFRIFKNTRLLRVTAVFCFYMYLWTIFFLYFKLQLSAVWHTDEAEGSILLCTEFLALFVCLVNEKKIWPQTKLLYKLLLGLSGLQKIMKATNYISEVIKKVRHQYSLMCVWKRLSFENQ